MKKQKRSRPYKASRTNGDPKTWLTAHTFQIVGKVVEGALGQGQCPGAASSMVDAMWSPWPKEAPRGDCAIHLVTQHRHSSHSLQGPCLSLSVADFERLVHSFYFSSLGHFTVVSRLNRLRPPTTPSQRIALDLDRHPPQVASPSYSTRQPNLAGFKETTP